MFFVPSAQTKEEIAAAKRVAGKGLLIVPVADLSEALAYLKKIGGSDISKDAIEL